MSTTHTTVIGITGTIGSGKSAVGKIIMECGVPVIDTDQVVHSLLAQDGPVKIAVIDRFGRQILDSSASAEGEIDRMKLGRIVFANESARKDLETIVHPAVILECRRLIATMSQQGESIVAVLVPLLFEANVTGEYDEIWTVVTSDSVLRERLKKRDKLSDSEIDDRLAAQWDQERKAASSHRVIDNSGSLEETAKQVRVLLDQLRACHSS